MTRLYRMGVKQVQVRLEFNKKFNSNYSTEVTKLYCIIYSPIGNV